MGEITTGFSFTQNVQEYHNIIKFSCPHCTDENGEFAEIAFYCPKNNPLGIATQANCTGQQELCIVLNDACQSFNSEKYLKAMCEKKDIEK